jgi:serine/threonine protein kinase
MHNIIRSEGTSEEWEQICMMRDSVEDKKDLWLIYELAPGKTMNEHLFEVKGEFYKGERIYMVHHSNFYHCLRQNITLAKEFIYRMSVALNMFARMGIVHADLKPENILIEYDNDSQTMRSMKIIDFGSAFILNPQGQVLQQQSEFMQSTPEYLPPEI